MVVSDSSSSEPSTKRRRCLVGEERTLGVDSLQSSEAVAVVGESTAKLPPSPSAADTSTTITTGSTDVTSSAAVNNHAMTSPDSTTTTSSSSTFTNKVCTIFIGGLHPRIMEAHIEKMCMPYGNIQRLHLCDRKGYAFCQYALPEQASAAMQALDGRGLLGRRLMVRPARSDQQQQQQRGGGGGHNSATTTVNQQSSSSGSSGGVSSSNSNPNRERERIEARIEAVKRKLQNAQSH